MDVDAAPCRSILTRTGGYLADVASHSLNPYTGCGLGRSLCGVGCYAQHNRWLTRGKPWGEHVTAKLGAAEAYRRQYDRERRWASERGGLRIFLASSTEPFQPAEREYGITRSVLEAMCDLPPDDLILQTHSPTVVEVLPLLRRLHGKTASRVHVSIESDRDTLPGLPKPAATVARRMEACRTLRDAGLRVVVTVAPLLPIVNPRRFFEQLGEVADAVVIDHFIGGDGTVDGSRTRRTALPIAMEQVQIGSTNIAYRHAMVQAAVEVLGTGRVGIAQAGFAGRMLNADEAEG